MNDSNNNNAKKTSAENMRKPNEGQIRDWNKKKHEGDDKGKKNEGSNE